MQFAKDHFSIFGLPERYDINVADLAQRYRELQKEVHPDKYANSTEKERDLAVRYASLINQAYDVLKSPLERAKYLLQLRGYNLISETHTMKDNEFLMRQLELRETLENIRNEKEPEIALDKIASNVADSIDSYQQLFSEQLGTNQIEAAINTVNKMQFMVKFSDEINRLEEELLD